MKQKEGSLLIGMLLVFMLLIIVVPVMVKWVENDTKSSVKDQKSTLAFNLADAAVDRGYWKVKSSTITLAQVSLGTSLAGYNFDAAYSDIPGGSYRIMVTSGPGTDQITIYGEGRDSGNKETRSIKAVYTNASVPGTVLAGGTMSMSGTSVAHWGPLMSKGDIVLSGSALTNHYPRKLAMQTVKPFDPTGDTNPPNTDSLEWWSNYYVQDLPIFDFDTMRASAAASGTLNCGSATGSWNSSTRVWSGLKPESSNNFTLPCNGTASECTGSVCKVGDIYADRRYDQNKVWYWDKGKTVTLYNTGVRGTIVVRGDLTLNGDDCYGPNYDTNDSSHYCGKAHAWNPTGPGNVKVQVPPNAWREYQKIDTVATNQYPGDLGLSSSTLTYIIGTSATESSLTEGDIGINGLLYVGGNLTQTLACDVYGSVWVEGTTTQSGNTVIFFNSKLKEPTLNVVLVRESWKEQLPSAQAWP